MAAKQARRRKPKTANKPLVLQMPTRWVRRVVNTSLIGGAAIAVVLMTRTMFDVPVRDLIIDGPFQRVSALQITEAAEGAIDGGFLALRLHEVREAVEALPWVDKASVRRVWPDQLHLVIIEQVPAARWSDRGLLNTRGELFIETAAHELAELPRLAGPDAEVQRVAAQYLALRGPLIEAGLGLRAVALNERGAWRIVLGNGVEVRLGRQSTEDRVARFVDVAAPVVARHETRIRYVDMRYSNGFSIGWKQPEYRQQARAEAQARAATLQGTP